MVFAALSGAVMFRRGCAGKYASISCNLQCQRLYSPNSCDTKLRITQMEATVTAKPMKTEVLQVRCDAELIDQLNTERRKEMDPPSRAEMARVLMNEALAARAKKGGQS